LYQNKYYICQNLSIMQIQLTNVSPEQLEALRSNFEDQMVISPAEDLGKYDVSIEIKGEMECWKLFFAGGEYVMSKFNHRINEIS